MNCCRLKSEVGAQEGPAKLEPQPLVPVAGPRRPPLAGVRAGAAQQMGAMAGAAAAMPRSKIVWLMAVLFSSRPGAVVAVEEQATGVLHPSVARVVLAGAPAAWSGRAWEAADTEAKKGQPRAPLLAPREVRLVGAPARRTLEGPGAPQSPMAAGEAVAVEDASAAGAAAALSISVEAGEAVDPVSSPARARTNSRAQVRPRPIQAMEITVPLPDREVLPKPMAIPVAL